MYYFTKEIFDAYKTAKEEGKERIKISLDLGISETLIATKTLDRILKDVKKIRDKEILIYDKKLFKPQIMTNALYKLALDENHFPVLYINGVKMNVGKEEGVMYYNKQIINNLNVKDTDSVLEVCTGLGYKTILLSEKAKKVLTIEKNKEVLELAKLNPYSKELFKRKNIEIKIGDAFEIVKKLKENSFNKILLDPPTFKFAPELYSEEFYLELNRISKENATLFHYTGLPGSRFRGKNIVTKTIEKLKESNWKIIKKANLGIYAKKI